MRQEAWKFFFAGNGLLFVLFWPCYTEHYVSKYLCASVPLMAALHFALVGMGAVADASLVASATVSPTFLSCLNINHKMDMHLLQ